MTTATYQQNRPTGVLFILFIIGIIIMLATTVSLHATQKHGEDAWTVRECINNNGPIESWDNPDTNRTAHIVCTPEGKFGIQICERNVEITCFLKNKMKVIDQVHTYLKNAGFKPPS
jgi:hypothetical protein